MENRIANREPEIEAKLVELPDKPGVYLYKDKKKKIIYIGKARSLRKRVRSYFTGEKDIKTRTLVEHIADLEFIITRNEYEALILENSLIKQWKPQYNINLKDGKSYPVIRITAEKFPRVFRTRRLIFDGSQYYGPFPSANQIDLYLDIIEHYFPLRKCRGALKTKQHPCLYYHIRRCAGVCCGKIPAEEYNETVRKIGKLLSGNASELVPELKEKMNEASGKLEYERAAKFRDQIRAVEHVKEVQSVVNARHNATKRSAHDYIGYAVKDDLCSFVVLQYRAGSIAGREIFSLTSSSGEEDTLVQFMLQYYGSILFYPDIIYLPKEISDESIAPLISDQCRKSIDIRTPKKGRHLKIISVAIENAEEDIMNRERRLNRKAALDELKTALGLPKLPVRIEGFDISHTSGEYTVASMVSFLNGLSDKAEYRYFRIKSLEAGQVDDYESIREAVARRYTRVINENTNRPDLILIDGGKGQVGAAHSILRKLGLAGIPLIGLAKQNEEIFFPDKNDPLVLAEGSASLRLLQAVRDESHRFAISLNKRLRNKSVSHSVLENMKGIGPKRSIALIKAFGSVRKIVEAGPDEVAGVLKLPADKAAVFIEELKQMYVDGRISVEM